VPGEELTRRRRIGVLLICCTSLLMVGLDITVVNVALPTIGRELETDVAGLQWTVDGFTVVLASLLLLAGSAADRFGRRRVFVTGLSVFTVASLLCSLAPSAELLVAFRALQAVGASMLNPVAMSIIVTTFTDPRERAQAVGVWGAVFGIALALGPVVGGTLVSTVGWPAIFWINVPIGLAAMVLTLRFVPESRAPRPRRFDPAGQVAVAVLLAASTFAIIEAPARGWTAAPVTASLAAAAVALVVLVLHEPRRAEPLIEVRFFRSVPFSAAVAIAVAAFASFAGFLFVTALLLQGDRGLSPFEAGLALLPVAAMTILTSPLSGRLVARRGPRVPLVASGLCSALAGAMLLGTDAGTPFVWLLAAYAVVGAGFGLVNAPITNAAVSGMPRAQAGVASAIATTSRQVGQTLGVAVVGALVGSHAAGGGATGSAADAAWWAVIALGGVVLVLGLWATTERARASAARVEHHMPAAAR
jgi:EmrB/QacA subfamily drug resistance transporter